MRSPSREEWIQYLVEGIPDGVPDMSTDLPSADPALCARPPGAVFRAWTRRELEAEVRRMVNNKATLPGTCCSEVLKLMMDTELGDVVL